MKDRLGNCPVCISRVCLQVDSSASGLGATTKRVQTVRRMGRCVEPCFGPLGLEARDGVWEGRCFAGLGGTVFRSQLLQPDGPQDAPEVVRASFSRPDSGLVAQLACLFPPQRVVGVPRDATSGGIVAVADRDACAHYFGRQSRKSAIRRNVRYSREVVPVQVHISSGGSAVIFLSSAKAGLARVPSGTRSDPSLLLAYTCSCCASQ